MARLIGGTPLAEIRRLNPERARGVEIHAKLEGRNPGGSVKDRAALAMIGHAQASGELVDGKTLIDATSGNTGIAYAMLGAAADIPVTLAMPSNASGERKRVLELLGADLILTDPTEGQDGAIDHVRDMVASDRATWYYPDQYSNPQNLLAHHRTTGPEIWRQTHARITHFVAALGTSGTAMGTTRFLKEVNARITCTALEPSGPFHGLEGLKHMATSHVPAIFERKAMDETRHVATERAYTLTKELARKEGFFVGPSSGAALAGAIDVAKDAPDGSVIVTVFPDNGDRYLSTPVFRAQQA